MPNTPDSRQGDAIVVTGLGMVSSLGPDVVTSCAAARAGITRTTELDFELLDESSLEMEPVIGHPIRGLTNGFSKFGRLARLGAAAFSDLIRYSRIPEHLLNDSGMIVHLRDHHYEDVHFAHETEGSDSYREDLEPHRRSAIEKEESHIRRCLIPKLFGLNGMASQAQANRCSFGGAATFVDGLVQATDLLRNDTVRACIVGGIDSLVEKETLERLSALRVLKTPDQPFGFVPGEAAAFVLLEPRAAAEARGARIEAVLESPTVALEKAHRFSDEPPTGRGLSQAIAGAFAALPDPTPDRCLGIGTLNGSGWHAQDFGNALTQMKARGLQTEIQHSFPAISFGETGAAAGGVASCLAVRGFARGHTRDQNALVWASSDDGARGAFFLSDNIRH